MRLFSRRKSNRSFSAPSLLATGKSPKSSHVSIAASHAVERLEGRVLLSVTNLGASDDAHVRGGTFEHQNFGTATLLEVKENSGDGFHRQSFLKFGLTSVPAGAGVVSAHLQLYGSRNNNDASINVRGHSSDTSWSESTVTYNTRPALDPAVLDSETVSSTAYQWYNWDVSSYVRGQVNGSASALSLGLTAELLTSPFARFNSKEATTNHPKLVVTTLLPASGLDDTASTSASVSLAWIDNSDNETGFKVQRSDDGGTTWATKTTTAANATSYVDSTVSADESYKYRIIATLTSPAVDSGASNLIDVITPPVSPPPPTGTPITLQATGDAYVRDGIYAEDEFGTLSVLQVKHDGTSYNRDSYMQFDVSGLSGTADSAVLRLHGSATVGSGTHSSLLVSAFSLVEPVPNWHEATINFTNRPLLQGWSSTTTALDSVLVSTTAGAAWYDFDVTAFINAEIAANRTISTIGLHVVAPVNVTANFDSKETAYDPELVVTPVVSPPAAPVAPSDLIVVSATGSQVNLQWTDNSSNETGFTMHRSTTSDFASYATFSNLANDTTYSDTTVTSQTTYYYRVRADNGGTPSGYSAAETIVPNDAPVISVAASASPSPVTGTTTTLSMTATDDGSTGVLTYHWQLNGDAPGPVDFPEFNGTESAESVAATFYASGAYTFLVVVADEFGSFAYDYISVDVADTLTSLNISGPRSISGYDARTFVATGINQFGSSLSTAPQISWAVTGGGTIVDGVFTPSPQQVSLGVITATAGNVSEAISIAVGEVAGTLFDDENGNGSQDSGEAGLSGWDVYVDEDGNNLQDPTDLGAVTSSDGNYALESSGCGCGILRISVPSGWVPTSNGGHQYEPEEPDPILDLDIDSDNNNGFAEPDESDAEEFAEDNGESGKIIPLNDGSHSLADFTPMVLKILEGSGTSDSRVVFEYEDAGSSGTGGAFRLYSGGGVYLMSEVPYALADVGLPDFSGRTVLRLEAVNPVGTSSVIAASLYQGGLSLGAVLGADAARAGMVRTFNTWQVSFGATVADRFRAVRQDATNFVYDTLQWQDGAADAQGRLVFNGSAGDAGERWYPVSYTRSGPRGNVVPTVGVNIHSVATLNPGKSYLVKGVMPGGASFGPVVAVQTTLFGQPTLATTLTANFTVAPHVNVEYYNIDFMISDDNGATWTSAGMSRTKVYVTGDDPVQSWTYKTTNGDNITNPFETVLDIGCRNAIGANSYNSIVNSGWDVFAKSVNNGKFETAGDYNLQNRSELRYWGDDVEAENQTANPWDTTTELLQNKAGQCGAWADLFADVLRAQGIECLVFGIVPTPGAYTAPAGFPTLFGFQINDSLPSQGSGGNGAPRNAFTDHAVVKLSVNGAVYDPSYGQWHSSEQAWRDAALSTLVYQNSQGNTETVDHVKGTADTTFTQMPW